MCQFLIGRPPLNRSLTDLFLFVHQNDHTRIFQMLFEFLPLISYIEASPNHPYLKNLRIIIFVGQHFISDFHQSIFTYFDYFLLLTKLFNYEFFQN